jgi:hypothetical protein
MKIKNIVPSQTRGSECRRISSASNPTPAVAIEAGNQKRSKKTSRKQNET